MKLILLLTTCLFSAFHHHAQENKEIESWITSQDRTRLFQKENKVISFSKENNPRYPAIIIDPNQTMQTIDGFGFAVTGGSAELLMKMEAKKRREILQNVYGTNPEDIGVSYVRLSIGSSDLNSFTFSYNDLEKGEEDYKLEKFSLSQDLRDVVPVMREILEINPEIKVMGSPWSAPLWMKTNDNIRGGKLKEDCYEVYADYFVKYILEMKEQGISIDAITIQNEPMNSRNTPSMSWFWFEQADFIKNHLGPKFKENKLSTKIVIFDHNTDRPDYPLSILQDTAASKFIDGSAFHNYRGNMESMSMVHRARPDKNIYFTEQMVTENPQSDSIDITGPVNRLVIEGINNWSRNIILWNLAADPENDPHTSNGGCSMCQGALTINGNKVSRNLAFYTIAHASKLVRPGSRKIYSTQGDDPIVYIYQDEQRPMVNRVWSSNQNNLLPNVAFKTPDDKIVLIVANTSLGKNSFKIQYGGEFAVLSLDPGSVGTFIWKNYNNNEK
ncbi:glycoside hydrolase family 30 beta sandwich domain-containing protein [Gramella sp. AN32]|uniref:Glycoside hydrolase family 30 beta sandwich domain-containing protein n=1 Tax=Christiangramia antarctica TaxID=2058158 RepID=A0ABW5X8E4_9FLAO|nr:glycoside hydrolase family 30 beta sandwich domain-containing protein [Gramella sp. AN32]